MLCKDCLIRNVRNPHWNTERIKYFQNKDSVSDFRFDSALSVNFHEHIFLQQLEVSVVEGKVSTNRPKSTSRSRFKNSEILRTNIDQF